MASPPPTIIVDSSGRGDGDWHNEWKDDELIDEKVSTQSLSL
jgi:hypothetical protein